MTPHYNSRRGSAWKKIAIIATSIIAIGLVGGMVLVRQSYSANTRPVAETGDQQLFTIESGATAREVATDLKAAGLIRADWAFEWYVRSHNLRDKLQAGSYYLRPTQSVGEIAGILTDGKVATDLVTILPSKRLDQISNSLVKAGFSLSEVQAALEPSQYKNHPALVDKPATATLEGYLYPDSYQKTANTNPSTIVRQSLDEMQKHLTPDIRAAFVKQGLTVHQGVTLASIVEKEVSHADDRPTVAQVFLTRLRDGILLGSDVTAFYGAIMADQEPSVTFDSPYNTRLHAGLPPGPISNVSESSLRAVAFPSKTDYVYFVAGDDGTTHFTRTLEEHNAATRKYCIKLCSQ